MFLYKKSITHTGQNNNYCNPLFVSEMDPSEVLRSVLRSNIKLGQLKYTLKAPEIREVNL